MFFHDGAIEDIAYEKEAMVKVCRKDDLETGETLWRVDRSVRLSEDRPMYQPARELIGDAELLGSETVDDDAMMGGVAVRSIYVSRPRA